MNARMNKFYFADEGRDMRYKKKHKLNELHKSTEIKRTIRDTNNTT